MCEICRKLNQSGFKSKLQDSTLLTVTNMELIALLAMCDFIRKNHKVVDPDLITAAKKIEDAFWRSADGDDALAAELRESIDLTGQDYGAS